MPGFLDLQTPSAPGIGGLLGADFQRQAAMQNIIGTLIGFGQGPSSVPLGFGARMAQAAKAGQQSQRDYETQQLQQALVGSQIGKLQQDAQQKRNLQASIAAMPDGPEKTRLMWAVNGVNPDQIAGSVPTKFGYESNGAVKPAYLQSIGQTTTAEEVPKAGAGALKTWLSFYPDVPITAGGGSQPQGASPEDAQSAINRLLGPNPMGQRPGGMPPPGAIQGGVGTQGLRGDAGMDDLTSPGGTTPTRVGGLPITNTADSGGIQLPPMRSRGVVPSTVPPAAVYGVQSAPEGQFGKDRGGGFGAYYQNVIKRMADIPSERAKLARLDSLLDQVYTGKGGDIVETAKQVAAIFGFDLGVVGPGEAATSLGRGMALELRNPSGGAGMPGALSDSDRQFLLSMVPGLATTPEGRKLMIDSKLKLLEREQAVNRLAMEYVRKHPQKQLDETFFLDVLPEWSAKHPLFNEKDVATLQKAATPEAAPAAPAAKSEAPPVSKRWVRRDGRLVLE